MESEIVLFIDENKTIKMLTRWLNGTNMIELKAQGSLRVLRKFVQSAFVMNYDKREIERTKTLDRMTKDIAIPSRNGRNIANNLQL